MSDPQGLQKPTHFRSYSSLRSSPPHSDDETIALGTLNNSRTALHEDYARDAPPQLPPMAYPPAPPGGPGHVAFSSVPLNDTPESRSGRSTPVGFHPRPEVRTMNSHSTINTTGGYHVNEKHDTRSRGGVQGLSSTPTTPTGMRHSFDAFAEAEAYNPSAAKDQNMRFADGDAGTNAFSRFYLWLVDRGIVVRWALFIIPVVALLWIPGIVDFVVSGPDRRITIWDVSLRWWSIWLTVAWVSLWGCKAFFMIFPNIFRQTIATIVPSMKQYTGVVANLGKYAKYLIWSIILNITFTPLVVSRKFADSSDSSNSALEWIRKLLIGFIICMAILLGEKALIQLIALAFHRDAYADRLEDQKKSLHILTSLYIKSRNIPGTDIGVDDVSSIRTKGSHTPKVVVRKALRGLKSVAQSTTTALGNVASEMAGSSVLQTNSPANKVKAAIMSANKSRALARRLYYSFRAPGTDYVSIEDIMPCFGFDEEKAAAAFAIFDRDGNGDATRDEMDAALLEMHRERMALEASIRDLDGAVRRLDEILIMLVVVVDIIVIIAMTGAADERFSQWLSGTATFILGLSWCINLTVQEILAACIFVFVKHPYDVGDRVDIDGNSYTVAKVELLSTSFKRVDGKFVWIAHNVLTTKVIENVRRSGPTSETFTFEVAFDTSFEKLQALREKMLEFCKENNRDFLPAFDVSVADIPGQSKMILKADIKYKSNWQLGALKVQRRNKWVCQLKIVLLELQIWGPDGTGNPDPPPADPTRYTEVPWAEVKESEQEKEAVSRSPPPSFDVATANLHSRYDSTTDLFDVARQGAVTPGGITPMMTPAGTPGIHPGHNAPIVPGSNPLTQNNNVRYANVPGISAEYFPPVAAPNPRLPQPGGTIATHPTSGGTIASHPTDGGTVASSSSSGGDISSSNTRGRDNRV